MFRPAPHFPEADVPLSQPPNGFSVGGRFIARGLAVAPMAGVSDPPFRAMCRAFGASYTVAEMVSVKPALRSTRKSITRARFAKEESPRVAQIVGHDPAEFSESARYFEAMGVEIIDINMGCPAKKVCGKLAGAALLSDERHVARILETVTSAVKVPVTLKFRTGVAPHQKNAVTIARIAQDSGIALLTLHGRTRACGFSGVAEYETIRAVKESVLIPVVANGDIDSAPKALQVLKATNADAVMIGRAAVGRPWIFREIIAAMSGTSVEVSQDEKCRAILSHLEEIYRFYGEALGVKMARKHLMAYSKNVFHNADTTFHQKIVTAETSGEQKNTVLFGFARYL